MIRVFAFFVLVALGGVAAAGPFCRVIARIVRGPCHVQGLSCSPIPAPCAPILLPGSPEPCPPFVTPPSEFKEEVQAAQAPSLPLVKTAPYTSPAPAIVGEKRPDAGPPSLIGKLLGDGKVQVELPDLSKIDWSKLPTPQVNISAPIPPKTLESFESTVSRLDMFLTFSTVVLSLFGVGKLGQWVAPVVSGLRNFGSALSALRQAQQSGALNTSPGVTPAEASTMPPPDTSSASPTGRARSSARAARRRPSSTRA